MRADESAVVCRNRSVRRWQNETGPRGRRMGWAWSGVRVLTPTYMGENFSASAVKPMR